MNDPQPRRHRAPGPPDTAPDPELALRAARKRKAGAVWLVVGLGLLGTFFGGAAVGLLAALVGTVVVMLLVMARRNR